MEEQKWIKRNQIILTIAILFLPSFYSYNLVPSIVEEWRLMAFTWQLILVVGEFGESLQFIPLPTLFAEPIVILYLPAFYLIIELKKYMYLETSRNSLIILSIISIALPWLTVLFPLFLTWFPTSIIIFPLPGIIGLIFATQKPRSKIWSEIPEEELPSNQEGVVI